MKNKYLNKNIFIADLNVFLHLQTLCKLKEEGNFSLVK